VAHHGWLPGNSGRVNFRHRSDFADQQSGQRKSAEFRKIHRPA
jgi:hypothetical protein